MDVRKRRQLGIIGLVVGFIFLAAGIFVMMLSNAVMNDPGVRLQMAFSQDASLRVAVVNGLSLAGVILGCLSLLTGILLLCGLGSSSPSR
jgi:hypothetical protein